MKRTCITIMLMASVAALASAQDPKVSLNAKTSATLATVDFDDSSNNTGVQLAGDDTFGAEFKGDKAGAYIAITGNLADQTLKIYDYYGWMKFGALKLTAGEYDNRGANRVKNEESSWKVWEKFKYGALRNGAIVKESDNVALWSDAEAVAEASLGSASFALSTGTNDTAADYKVFEQFAARVSYAVPDSLKLTAAFSQYQKDRATAGVFAEILSVKDLNLVAGYSGAYDWATAANNVNAAELRARYSLEGLAVTTHNNLSVGKDTITAYDMLNVAYRVTDSTTILLYANNVNVSGDAAKTAGKAGNTLTVRPGVTLLAQKGATIDAGVEFSFAKPDGSSMVSTMSIPVVFRVKF